MPSSSCTSRPTVTELHSPASMCPVTEMPNIPGK